MNEYLLELHLYKKTFLRIPGETPELLLGEFIEKIEDEFPEISQRKTYGKNLTQFLEEFFQECLPKYMIE